jgi:choline dehydrogenase
VHYSRGKSLGGSTNLNYMAYTHTSKGALERWAETVGDDVYAYENSARFYRKSMNFSGPAASRLENATVEYDAEVGTQAVGGPLDVSYSSHAQGWSTWLARAMDALGIANTKSFIDGNLLGSAWLTSTINPRNGHRESAETAFLGPLVLARPNLRVFDLTLAERVLFDAGRKATGVQARSRDPTANSSQVLHLHARREVIVSGGAFQSPQLLQLSGVGPADLLTAHGIPVVADRPGVGSGLEDHVFFGIAYRVDVQTNSALQYGTTDAEAVEQFNANGTGILASPGGDYVGYEKLPPHLRASMSPSVVDDLAMLPPDWPEMQYLSLPAYVGNFDSASTGSPPDGYMYATLLATLIAPSSVGNVTISSSSASDPPVINPNWLTTQRDIELVVAGFKRLRQILGHQTMANVTIGPEYYPGLAGVQTDAEIHQQIKRSFNTMYHASSTCKMGRVEDEYAVVDAQARVYGVERRAFIQSEHIEHESSGLTFVISARRGRIRVSIPTARTSPIYRL